VIETADFAAIRRIPYSAARAAYLASQIGEPYYIVAELYLRAAWESEDTGKHEDELIYLKKTLDLYTTYLAITSASDKTLQPQIMVANLERRLSRFGAAIERIGRLKFDTNNSRTSRLRKISNQIKRLALKRNSSPALMPRPPRKSRRRR
jgi:hypothetical protein